MVFYSLLHKFINKMVQTYVTVFSLKPKKSVKTPLLKGDNTEIDILEFLGN